MEIPDPIPSPGNLLRIETDGGTHDILQSLGIIQMPMYENRVALLEPVDMTVGAMNFLTCPCPETLSLLQQQLLCGKSRQVVGLC